MEDPFALVDKNCIKCDLHFARTNVVPGFGNTKAKIVFIGEAPGKNEDIQRVPFVGAAGKKFDSQILNFLELSRNEIAILNAVKCRPVKNGKNTAPSYQQVGVCAFEYLYKQLLTINPKIAVIMGRIALYALTTDLPNSISEVRGSVLNKKYVDPQLLDHIKFFVLAHPAVMIYNVDEEVTKGKYKKDLTNLKQLIKEVL